MKVENFTMDSKEITLSVDNICSIIKLCSTSGISNFRYGELSFDFKDKNQKEPMVIPSTFQGHESESNEIEEDLADGYLPEVERDLKAIELQNLFLEDPYQAELIEAMGDRVDEFLEQLKGDKDAET